MCRKNCKICRKMTKCVEKITKRVEKYKMSNSKMIFGQNSQKMLKLNFVWKFRILTLRAMLF